VFVSTVDCKRRTSSLDQVAMSVVDAEVTGRASIWMEIWMEVTNSNIIYRKERLLPYIVMVHLLCNEVEITRRKASVGEKRKNKTRLTFGCATTSATTLQLMNCAVDRMLFCHIKPLSRLCVPYSSHYLHLQFTSFSSLSCFCFQQRFSIRCLYCQLFPFLLLDRELSH